MIPLKTSVLPVKWIPAKLGELIRTSPMPLPEPGTKLITPSGKPASCKTLNTTQLDRIAVEAGFQRTTLPKGVIYEGLVLPIIAGEVDKFAPMAVKLKGEIATTYPS